jgi:hypothetical protein
MIWTISGKYEENDDLPGALVCCPQWTLRVQNGTRDARGSLGRKFLSAPTLDLGPWTLAWFSVWLEAQPFCPRHNAPGPNRHVEFGPGALLRGGLGIRLWTLDVGRWTVNPRIYLFSVIRFPLYSLIWVTQIDTLERFITALEFLVPRTDYQL